MMELAVQVGTCHGCGAADVPTVYVHAPDPRGFEEPPPPVERCLTCAHADITAQRDAALREARAADARLAQIADAMRRRGVPLPAHRRLPGPGPERIIS